MNKIHNHVLIKVLFFSFLISTLFFLGSLTAVLAAPSYDVNETQIKSLQQYHNSCALKDDELLDTYGQEDGAKISQYCRSENVAEIVEFCTLDDSLSNDELGAAYDQFFNKYFEDSIGNNPYGLAFCAAAQLLSGDDGSLRDDVSDAQVTVISQNLPDRIRERDALAVDVLDKLGCADRASTGPTDICEQPDFRVIEYCRNPNVTDSACDEVKERLPVQTIESQTTEGDTPPSCLNEGGDNSWLICPFLNGLDGAISYLDNQINSLLFIPEAYYNDENKQLEKVWSSFRDIAYLLLIPILLVMVIGTALGFQFLDSYTVKRALPRLFVAVIFIAVSLPLLRIVVNLVNEIGQGVYGLISSVGSNDGEEFSLQGLFNPNPVQDTGATILLIAGGVAVIKFLLPFLALLALAVLLQLAAIFILLAFRQFLIIALMVVAPLAILAWIFPGNDKLWKIWWGSFWKLLLIYPIIMALLAIGRVFAEIVQGAPGTQGLPEVIIKLVAYIGPFFLIPAAFKYAGGVFANIAGIVNDKERGPLDRLRKGRQKSLADKHQGAMDATGKQGKGMVGSLYRRGANLGKNGSFTPTKAGRNRWKQQEQLVKEAAADKLLKEGGGRAFNDDDASELLKQRGMTKSTFVEKYAKFDEKGNSNVGDDKRFATEADRIDAAQSALARAELATGAKVGTDSMAVGAQKFRTAMTNTAYRSGPDGLADLQKDLVQMQKDGLITEADAAGWMKSNKGRTDFSSNGFVDTINFAKGDLSAQKQLEGAFRGADPREVVGGHKKALESFAAVAKKNFESAVAEQNNALASGDSERVKVANKSLDYAAADVAGIYDTLGSVSPQKASKFAKVVMEQSVETFGGRKTTIRAMVEQSRGRPADVNGVQPFLERRREYGSQVPPELRGQGPLPPPEPHG